MVPNRFPINFIDRFIKQFLQKFNVTKATDNKCKLLSVTGNCQGSINKKRTTFSFTFLCSQYFLIGKPLQSWVKSRYHNAHTILFGLFCLNASYLNDWPQIIEINLCLVAAKQLIIESRKGTSFSDCLSVAVMISSLMQLK